MNKKSRHIHSPGWVEFFSGGIQLYQECHRKKLLPVREKGKGDSD